MVDTLTVVGGAAAAAFLLKKKETPEDKADREVVEADENADAALPEETGPAQKCVKVPVPPLREIPKPAGLDELERARMEINERHDAELEGFKAELVSSLKGLSEVDAAAIYMWKTGSWGSLFNDVIGIAQPVSELYAERRLEGVGQIAQSVVSPFRGFGPYQPAKAVERAKALGFTPEQVVVAYRAYQTKVNDCNRRRHAEMTPTQDRYMRLQSAYGTAKNAARAEQRATFEAAKAEYAAKGWSLHTVHVSTLMPAIERAVADIEAKAVGMGALTNVDATLKAAQQVLEQRKTAEAEALKAKLMAQQALLLRARANMIVYACPPGVEFAI
jgi:hypothetical protein